MKFLFAVSFIFLLFGVQNINAQSADAETITEALPGQKLSEKLARLETYQASFKQTVTEDDGYVLDENSGVMSFERPSKLYWSVLEPFPNLLISDGQDVYFYDPDLNQVTVRNWSHNPSENPIAVFVSETDISDYYDVEEMNGAFQLRPKSLDAGFLGMRIEFDNDDGLKAMRIVDSLGQITTLSFFAIEEEKKDKNRQIPQNPYSFTIPATAEVIDDS